MKIRIPRLQTPPRSTLGSVAWSRGTAASLSPDALLKRSAPSVDFSTELPAKNGIQAATAESAPLQLKQDEVLRTSQRSYTPAKSGESVLGSSAPLPYRPLIQRQTDSAAPNTSATALPEPLRFGIEKLSGMSMEGVKVHYNSSRPTQLSAHAYTRGSEIHVAPGQERHLPHEAWHVVQQRQGRVQETAQLKGKGINDSSALESEADIMGDRALRAARGATDFLCQPAAAPAKGHLGRADAAGIFQFYKTVAGGKQGGTFVGDPAGIHCHIDIGHPHLKLGGQGRRIDFGRDMHQNRLQAAYMELISGNYSQMSGYEDCKEYLEEQGCAVPEKKDPPTLIELGLAQGSYPPKLNRGQSFLDGNGKPQTH